MAKPFPSSGYGAFREGFVVQFESNKIGTWVGNFQLGSTTFSGAYQHPDEARVIVVSGGAVYIVNPDTQAAEELNDMVYSANQLSEGKGLLFDNGTYLSLIGRDHIWRTSPLSWDGIRNLSVSDEAVFGEGWYYDDTWHRFSVSIHDGSHTGGACDPPDFIPIKQPELIPVKYPWWQFWKRHA